MKHIEKSNVARENWNRFPHVLMAQIDVSIGARGDAAPLPDFPSIDIEAQDRLPATAFAKIKREQTKPAADIQDRVLRAAKEFVSRRIDGIVPQLAPYITAQPPLGKMGGDAGARRLMFTDLAWPVFHLLRIIALPD
jgi:hypothetical protein